MKNSEPAEPATEALPQYLLDRSNEKNAKALSSAIKQKRQEKAARFSVPRMFPRLQPTSGTLMCHSPESERDV